MRKKMTTDQIRELLELDKLCGIHTEIQELIRRLTDGGAVLKSDDPRVFQAKVLWDKGLGRGIGIDTFEDYLATIPQIPTTFIFNDTDFPLLRLVDPRLGLVNTCKLFGIKFEEFGYSDADVVPCDDRHEIPNTPFWVRAHDGCKNRNRKPSICRDECSDKFFAMTAMVAIMVWVQDPSIIKEDEHVLDCPGSVHRSGRGFCAYLDVWGGEVELYLGGYAGAVHPHCGSGGFRRE